MGKIILDKKRFEEILDRTVRKSLHKYIVSDKFVLPDKTGKGKITIPIPRIDIPRFEFETRQMKGVGQGEGEEGDEIGGETDEEGSGRAGNKPGEHPTEEIEISEDEFFKILGEELELPFIEPKGKKVREKKYLIKGVRKTGPESLRNFKRTYKEALKRQIISGTYDYNNPVIIPIKNDKRYRSFKEVDDTDVSAVIFHLIDVSGSIDNERREIIRRITYCIDGWIARFYKEVEQRYIIHDTNALEVDRDTFFYSSTGGGTIISSAFELLSKIIDKNYPEEEWNIYVFYFSDGENWDGEDNRKCIKLISQLIPKVNLIGLGELLGSGPEGDFFKDIKRWKKNHLRGESKQKVVVSDISSRNDIIKTIKIFLGKK
jgi:uncharacterized sporulation protein YeaH/YhbH (DUF444 family)